MYSLIINAMFVYTFIPDVVKICISTYIYDVIYNPKSVFPHNKCNVFKNISPMLVPNKRLPVIHKQIFFYTYIIFVFFTEYLGNVHFVL